MDTLATLLLAGAMFLLAYRQTRLARQMSQQFYLLDGTIKVLGLLVSQSSQAGKELKPKTRSESSGKSRRTKISS
jgi:hypothetical protein